MEKDRRRAWRCAAFSVRRLVLGEQCSVQCGGAGAAAVKQHSWATAPLPVQPGPAVHQASSAQHSCSRAVCASSVRCQLHKTAAAPRILMKLKLVITR